MAKKVAKAVSKKEKFRQEKKKAKTKKNIITWTIAVVIIVILGTYFMSLEDEPSIEEVQADKVYGDDVIEMNYFHWTRCSHCIEQSKFNKILIERYPNLRITEYEITEEGTMEKYKEFAESIEELDAETFPGTPLTIIGQNINIGYGTDETTGLKLVSMIEEAQKEINDNWDDSTMKRTVDLQTE